MRHRACKIDNTVKRGLLHTHEFEPPGKCMKQTERERERERERDVTDTALSLLFR